MSLLNESELWNDLFIPTLSNRKIFNNIMNRQEYKLFAFLI